MAYQTSTNHYQTTKYIVDATGATPYTTIQSAINAANAAGGNATVYIRNGTYTENLTLYTTVNLEGPDNAAVTIVGTHTPPNTGDITFSRVGFQSATDVFSSAAAGTTVLRPVRCRFIIADGYIFNLANWTGDLRMRYCTQYATSVTCGIVNNSGTAPIIISYSSLGKGTAKSLTFNGAATIESSTIYCPMVISGAAVSYVYGGCYFAGMISIGGTANIYIANSTISTGAVTALTVTTATPITLENVVINTSNATAIAGTGTVNFAETTFVNSKALAGTITEGLAGVVKTGEIYANTVLRMDMSGFYSWAAGGPYYDDTTLGSFTVLVGGTGYIRGKVITWAGPQTVAGMTSGSTWYIYIDSTGTIGKTNVRSDALFVNYIVLFQCLYDETTGTKVQYTVKENHTYNFQTMVSNYAHDVIGCVIENNENGANITLVGPANVKIAISGDDDLEDNGLVTDIPDSAGAGVVFNKMYTTAGGKWARDGAASDTFLGRYNNAGTATNLGANKFGVYRLYVSKDDLNAVTPKYFATLDITQYNSLAAANTAIGNGTPAGATNELAELEMAQLGYIIWSQAAGAIVSVIIEKATLRSSYSSAGTNTASLINTNTTNFNGILSAADTNVQAALDTIDNWGAGTTDKSLVVGNGAGVALGVIAVGATGTILTGVTANDPTWTTATYPATVAKGDVLVASADNVIGIVAGAATAGYVLMANGAGSAPTFQAPPPMTWSIKTVDLDPMVINNGYIANKAGLLTFTLPATSVVGAVLRVTGMNTAVGWRIAQRANQIIHWSNTLVTTTGAGGYLESTDKYDAVEIVCSVADLEWVVLSSKGNITIA